MTRPALCFLLGLFLFGCAAAPGRADAGCSDALFGRPVAQTGLSADACKPACACSLNSPVTWTDEQLTRLKTWQLDPPYAEVTVDPYDSPPADKKGVCAMVITDAGSRIYRLETFETTAAVADAGARLTHHGACGVCSPLTDLAVYASDPDLGRPVRQCGVDSFGKGFEANVQCLQALGFTRPCAQIWAWNTANTRRLCLDPCVRFADSPYHEPDGGLNGCLACDEVKSGPVFKAVAGRTRRNTGVPSAICRPCSETAPVPHDYP